MIKSIIFLLLIVPSFVNSQNLIKNGDFEVLYKCPQELDDFYATYWSSCSSGATPDLFSYCSPNSSIMNPNSHWCRVRPIKDSSFAGLILLDLKTNYREYITSDLKETLIRDTVYKLRISMAVPYISRWKSGHIDVVFTDKPLRNSNSNCIQREASIELPLDSLRTDGSWMTIIAKYKANGTERFISLGNFNSSKETFKQMIPGRTEHAHLNTCNQAYICVDDIILVGESVYDSYMTKPQTSTAEQLVKTGTVTLNNINFKTDSWELEDNEIEDLNNIVAVLKTKSNLNIIIEGHTDNVGSDDHNLELSENRAKSVAQYMIKKGIESNRISTNGFGAQKPVNSNTNETERQQNRRVEIRLN